MLYEFRNITKDKIQSNNKTCRAKTNTIRAVSSLYSVKTAEVKVLFLVSLGSIFWFLAIKQQVSAYMVVCVCAVFGQREKKKVMNYTHQVENCQKEIHLNQ